ncbi:hypothetical protein D4764_13G0007780 [Takifugu flavidus]|uniref:Uncharacterized protein n=1 Tax=Takifugu flavidus TaxID=433684 RepID=A0A5C6PAB9_9TELE|nr:hypothetical protein D4764_13G0007780 [Takifugu flavidus]
MKNRPQITSFTPYGKESCDQLMPVGDWKERGIEREKRGREAVGGTKKERASVSAAVSVARQHTCACARTLRPEMELLSSDASLHSLRGRREEEGGGRREEGGREGGEKREGGGREEKEGGREGGRREEGGRLTLDCRRVS